MGTFIGHISPGIAFLSFGLLYAVRFSSLLARGQRTLCLPGTARRPGVRGCVGRVPAEGVMKVVYSTVAVLAEFFYPPGVDKLHMYNPDKPGYPFIHPNEWQHATMYAYFALSGWVDIISQACLPRRVHLCERVAIALPFYIEALLLYHHAHGKQQVESTVHSLLLLACLLVCVVLTAELWRPNEPLLWFAKTCLVMVKGSWLLHAAFILYRPFLGQPWADGDMANLMFLTNFFCWHLALNASLLLAIYWFTALWLSRCRRCRRHLAGANSAFHHAKDALVFNLPTTDGTTSRVEYHAVRAAEEETHLLQECEP